MVQFGALVVAILIVAFLAATTFVPGSELRTTGVNSNIGSETSRSSSNSTTTSLTHTSVTITNFTPTIDESFTSSNSTKAQVSYGCRTSNSAVGPTVASVNDTVHRVVFNFSIQVSPPLSVEGLGCSFTTTKIVTPTACGVMCGGQVGTIVNTYDIWLLNFSVGSADYLAGHNLTISSGGFSFISLHGTQIYLNDQQLMSFYSNPPCVGGDGVEEGCIDLTAPSVSVELPASFGNGQYQLAFFSQEILVP